MHTTVVTSAPVLLLDHPVPDVPVHRPSLYLKWELVNGKLMARWLQQPD